MNEQITGALFKRMVLHGAAVITAQKQAINDLNVFPVPDGDTGTNMSLTMKSTVKEISALDELARLLGLHQVPNYIEAYDISNIGSETIVAGMVVFENGRPCKKYYKKVSIKTVAEQMTMPVCRRS